PKEVTKQMYDLIFIKNFSFHQLFPDLPNDAMEETYLIAKTYYESGNYKDAFPLFYTLVLYDHHNYGYVLGSAACLHLLGNYALAAKGYSLAYAADTSNPTPLFYAAECLEKIKQHEAAIFLLGMAIAISSNKKEYKTLKEQAILNQAALKKLNLGGK
ncbi:MAG: SycD/LcrH family type III secretion system chaperone, partial [Chlamydiota bacterium]